MALKFGYLIERDEGDKVVEYRPTVVPTDLPNLAYVEGPNSSGKSTLLHLIAAAFYGQKLKKLDEGLKAKVAAFVDPSHQRTTFDVTLSNEDGTLKLVARKENADSAEIVVEEFKGTRRKLMTSESFERDYRLIYDIPNDPTQRLLYLIDEVTQLQAARAASIAGFRRRVDDILREISDARDPKRIDTLKEVLGKQDAELKTTKSQMADTEELLVTLRRFHAVRALTETLSAAETVDQSLRQAKKTQKKSDRERKKVSAETSAALTGLLNNCRQLTVLRDETIPVLKEVTDRKDLSKVDAWRSLDFIRASSELEFPSVLPSLIADFRNRLREARRNPTYGAELERAEVFAELARTLEKFSQFNEPIPGTGKTIKEMIHALEDQSRQNITHLRLAQNLKKASDAIEAIHKLVNETGVLFATARKAPRSPEHFQATGEEDDEPDDLVERLTKEAEELMTRGSEQEAQCVALDVNVEQLDAELAKLEAQVELAPFRSYSEGQLVEAISEREVECDRLERAAEKLTRSHAVTESELAKLERKEPHAFQDKVEVLNEVKVSAMRMEQRLQREYHQFAGDLRHGKPLPGRPDAAKYADAIGAYLGKKIGRLRHVDQEYTVERIDMVKREVITGESKRILLADMGTGQSQSAYLQALLGADDGRKIIALFDEVAMMDEKSLSPVYARMRELRDEGKLLLGIVVQRADALTVKAI